MAVVTQPFIFATGQIPTAAQWNANPQAWVAGFANIDNTNIGAAGLYASQIKPSGVSTATFGGTQNYTFPAGILATQGGTGGYVAPVYTSADAVTAATQKMIPGTTTFALSGGLNYLSSAITLSGAAIFSSSSSYTVICSGSDTTVSTTAGFVPYVAMLHSITSGSVFTLAVETANGLTNNSTTASLTVNWLAIGT